MSRTRRTPRTLPLLVLLAACGKPGHHAPPSPRDAGALAAHPAAPATPTDPLLAKLEARVKPSPPAEHEEWAGTWAGSRPFDQHDPFAHRGPTRAVVEILPDGKIRLSEGIKAAKITVELTRDPANPNIATGKSSTSEDLDAVVYPEGGTRRIHVDRTIAAAAVMSRGKLSLARRIDESGSGIQTRHEEDAVELGRVPPPPPAPPPPPGFEVIAAAQPAGLAEAGGTVVWLDLAGEQSAIRAVSAHNAPVILASQLQNVRDLVIHGDQVYFAEQFAGRIARVPLAGGAVVTVQDGAPAERLAIAGSTLVYKTIDEEVYLRPLAGGTPRLLANLHDEPVHELAFDDAAVYVSTLPIGIGDKRPPSHIYRLPLSGGKHALSRDEVCGALVARGAYLYYGTCDGELKRLPKDGGGATVLARDQLDIAGITIAGDEVVWCVGAGRGEILAVKPGGKPRTIMHGPVNCEHIVVGGADGKTLYVEDVGWDTREQGRIGKIAL